MDAVEIAAEHAARLAALDGLLAPPEPLAGAVLTTRRGAAAVAYQEAPVGTAARTWEPARKHTLDPRLAGPDRAAVLGDLLDQWDLGRTEPGDLDSAAVVELPSRDTEAIPALVHRGFVPASVVAARRAGRGAPRTRDDVRIRPATPDDLDVAVELNMQVVHYDAAFGRLTPRDDTAEAIGNQVAFLLHEPEPVVWLAELGGRVVGLVHIQLPPVSDWARRYTRVEPTGYLACLGVRPELRGTGVGAALAAHAHAALDGAGLPLTLLHHALPNPRSTPFWYSHGYRPLWTIWMRRPARR